MMFPPEFPGFQLYQPPTLAALMPRLTPPDSCAPTQQGKWDSQRRASESGESMWGFKPTGGGFHSHGGTRKRMVYNGKSLLKWMITRGSPTLGNPQMGKMGLIFGFVHQE